MGIYKAKALKLKFDWVLFSIPVQSKTGDTRQVGAVVTHGDPCGLVEVMFRTGVA
jgi:hypothetical protein